MIPWLLGAAALAVVAAAVLASMLSVELGIAVALFELGLGVVVGNAFDLHSQAWLDFVASFASVTRRLVPRGVPVLTTGLGDSRDLCSYGR